MAVISELFPKMCVKALQNLERKIARSLEIHDVVNCGTWELVPHLDDANIVMCEWMFLLKYDCKGSIALWKAPLVACESTQAYGIDYQQTFF